MEVMLATLFFLGLSYLVYDTHLLGHRPWLSYILHASVRPWGYGIASRTLCYGPHDQSTMWQGLGMLLWLHLSSIADLDLGYSKSTVSLNKKKFAT